VLEPGATIGILGGGQLGRMTALAAARLGYRAHVFCPGADDPAAQVTSRTTISSFADRAALAAFARAVDVVTLEFENIPLAAVEQLEGLVPVRPGAAVLAVCQDRIAEKRFAGDLGIATAPWAAVGGPGDLPAALAAVGLPAVLKATRMGYDGKAQALLRTREEAEAALAAIGGPPAIAEGLVDFAMELSVIAARGADGGMASYPAVENRHALHILKETIVPAPVAPALAAAAEDIARRLAEALGVVGLLAVEMFLTREGTLLVNELAPRPHNSGHWTIDAAATSQFEQLVRAVVGAPLGSCERVADAVMENLLGEEAASAPVLMAEPGARVHLYGKGEMRPGRKMGHVTRLLPPRAPRA
jgi:5-(carboxyamino)imidazole ribonucleotide synthase